MDDIDSLMTETLELAYRGDPENRYREKTILVDKFVRLGGEGQREITGSLLRNLNKAFEAPKDIKRATISAIREITGSATPERGAPKTELRNALWHLFMALSENRAIPIEIYAQRLLLSVEDPRATEILIMIIGAYLDLRRKA